MSQVPPISSASSENSNVPSVNAWNNQAYDTSQMYSHQVAGQPFPQLQNWIYTGYPQNVPIIPGPQFPVQNLPPTVPPTQAAPQKFEDSDEEENDENEPPRKSPRLSNESKYLNLDANFQSNFFSPPTSFTQSTPKMTGVYTGNYELEFFSFIFHYRRKLQYSGPTAWPVFQLQSNIFAGKLKSQNKSNVLLISAESLHDSSAAKLVYQHTLFLTNANSTNLFLRLIGNTWKFVWHG
jgi:hypothetical protein